MRRSVNSFEVRGNKVIRLLGRFARMSLMESMSFHRSSFWFLLVGKIIRELLLILFFQVVFRVIPMINGWTLADSMLLLAVYLTVEWLIRVSFYRNLAYYLPQSIRKGTFDLKLVRPGSSLFYAAFERIDPIDLLGIGSVLIVWGYAFFLGDWTITWFSVIMFLALMIVSYLFLFAILIFLSTTAFWTVLATGVGNIFGEICRLGRLTTDIYQGTLRWLFVTILPVGIISTIPTEVLLGRATPIQILFAVGITAIVLRLAVMWWNHAVNYYTSASS
jgi:ABC-2 type transport system permease protein